MRSLVCGSFVACVALAAGAPARADDQARAREILDQAIQATGGQDRLGKNKAVTWKGRGKVQFGGQAFEFTGEWWVQPPRQMKNQLEIDANGTTISLVTVVNGDKGWTSMMGNTTEMEADRLAEGKEELYAGTLGTLVPLRDKVYKLTPLGEKKVGDRPAVGLKVEHEGHKPVEMYFDKDKHLLLATKRRVKDMAGQEVDQETLYADHKDFGGIRRARKLTIKRDGTTFVELEITEFKAEPKLDDSVFGKPGE
jgi:hypothetical protein